MSPVGLDALLAELPRSTTPDLLVGFETGDDAGAYRLSDELALVTTADFITPPVDDPATFGRIAAANALSDVYAMGGRPLTCLNLVAFPSRELGPDVLEDILRGALEVIGQADAHLVGGHSVEDAEPKFGLAVNGLVHPDELWRNAGARPGQALVLTKALGTGVLFNAHRKGWVDLDGLAPALASSTRLNRAAAEALAPFRPAACTDVTGFGLAGHSLEMARSSGVRLRLDFERLPLLDDAIEQYRAGVGTGLNLVNRQRLDGLLTGHEGLEEAGQELLFDPQTNGGLLVALEADRADEAVAALREAGDAPAAVIGRVEDEVEGGALVIA
ncbi:MAG: selenide, water dikinase SelD [Acidobacteriota bacterium]